MLIDCLPLATPYDPAEDPPSSIDPLGTVASAEQLADILLPGLTARMWRARHLTFTALAALVGERAAAIEGGSEEMRLEARLGLERLFVSAVAWKDESKEEGWGHAARRLPGTLSDAHTVRMFRLRNGGQSMVVELNDTGTRLAWQHRAGYCETSDD